MNLVLKDGSLPDKTEQYSRPKEIAVELITLAIYLKIRILGGKRNRTKAYVKSEYNDTAWKNILEGKYWKQTKTLEEFCSSVDPSLNHPALFLIHGRFYRTAPINFYRIWNDKIYKLFTKFISEDDEIVEIGCGVGSQSFFLRACKLNNIMYGIDISENSIKAANEINERFHSNIKFKVMDITEPINSDFITNKTVFTAHVLEQLKYQTEKVIQNILRAKPKQVLHFEPVKELFKNNLKDIIAKQAMKVKDYPDNLLTTLRKFEKMGLLKITDAHRLYLGAAFNDTSFIRWIPLKVKL